MDWSAWDGRSDVRGRRIVTLPPLALAMRDRVTSIAQGYVVDDCDIGDIEPLITQEMIELAARKTMERFEREVYLREFRRDYDRLLQERRYQASQGSIYGNAADHEIPDTPLEEWNTKVDALLAECASRQEKEGK